MTSGRPGAVAQRRGPRGRPGPAHPVRRPGPPDRASAGSDRKRARWVTARSGPAPAARRGRGRRTRRSRPHRSGRRSPRGRRRRRRRAACPRPAR
ncbi:hypothetical protein DEF23_07060 [Marinitenerispora sediminis]|nr:hypothetical protein DEF28_01090 [Marinitenerispora sediminis]RCV59535.1 hypothetical protein DEF23_07060 [Marinitenerispora sediminis]